MGRISTDFYPCLSESTEKSLCLSTYADLRVKKSAKTTICGGAVFENDLYSGDSLSGFAKVF